MSEKRIIKFHDVMMVRVDKFIKEKGLSMGLDSRTAVARRALDEYLKEQGY